MKLMDKEQKAIERIKLASQLSLQKYGKPLICTYSGGKDSEVLLELFKRSGVPFEAHNSHTTVDAPETVYHIRQVFHDLENEGGARTNFYATVCRGANNHVEVDRKKAHATNKVLAVLLPNTERARRQK